MKEEFLEIDLGKVFSVLWKYKPLYLRMFPVFITLGILTYWILPKQFHSSIEIIQDSGPSDDISSDLLGNIGGLGSLDFLGGSNQQSYLSPSFAPIIARSRPFQLLLLLSEFNVDNQNQELYKHIEQSKLPPQGHIVNILETALDAIGLIPEDTVETYNQVDDVIYYNRSFLKLVKKLDEMIAVSFNEETSVIEISVITQNPKLSGLLATRISKLLQSQLTDYKIEKLAIELEKVQEKIDKSERIINNKKSSLITFLESNKNVISEDVKFRLQSMQTDYNLSFSILNSLYEKKEEIELQLNSETPIYHTIQPANIPIKKASPQLLTIMFVYIFLSVSIWLILILVKERKRNK
ncbi:hypothetical protein [Ekhidna sp.]|uniref:hypothetical protein n=1 Tax=Ekhidna sp. TaxID=2608089 RepID=UPI0032F0145D